jgi:type I restriction enzyme, S subunit
MIDNFNINKSNWKLVKLGDVVEEINLREGNPSTSEYKRFVGLEHFISGNLKIKDWKPTDDLVSAAKVFQSGDILFARRNAYLKRASMVEFDGLCSGDAFVLREDHTKIEPGYLSFIVNSDSLWEYANSNAAGTMSKRVKWRDLAEYEFLLPPKPQQEKIAELLWAMDDVREKGKEVFTRTDTCFKVLAKVIADIDKNHTNEYKKIKDVCDIKDNLRKPLNSSQRSKMKGDIPYYGANGLVDYLDNYIFDEELILMAEDGGNFSEFFKKPIAYKVNGKSWVNNHAHVLTVKESKLINYDWLYYSLVHKNVLKYVIGTTRVKLNKGELENIQIWVPEEDKQNELISEIKRFEKIRTESKNQINNSEQLQKSLINEIFSS